MLVAVVGTFLSTAGFVNAGPQSDAKGVAFFEQKIRPILVEHCYACHSQQAKKVRGGLLLDSKAGWERGGDRGEPIIVPGKPGESLLLQALRHEQGLAMPPNKKLSDRVQADFITWINLGAPAPRVGAKLEAKRADKNWWSLQPLKMVKIPANSGSPESWSRNPIDAFIDAKLREKGLAPNPPADPRSLIRRMSYDVLGLPPSADEVRAFVRDFQQDADRATATLADRLLASPHYGEHWGRHWLDVVRFGESNGFERNFIIDDLWPFRDFVIRSFNDDKPFNQFIVEHLAADVLAKNNPDVEVGSAFLVAGPFDDVGNQDAVAAANIRAATLDDVITATSSAFLGLTVNCARCHHHKFDPVPMDDYYRIRAAFEGIQHGRRVIASQAEREAHANSLIPLEQQRAKIQTQRNELQQTTHARIQMEVAKQKPTRPRIDPNHTEERFPAIEAKYVRFVVHAHTSNPAAPAGARLTEFEVWTTGAEPQNVALASRGAKADGARSVNAGDFAGAYGPHLVIDGMHGEQWFIGSPPVLTITLAEPRTIDRISFANTLGDTQRPGGGALTPCEYEVLVSSDGANWTKVADSRDREPWTPNHGVERVRRALVTGEEKAQLAEMDRQLAVVQQKLSAVPPLRQVWAGNFVQPAGRTHIHQGGDPMKPGEAVLPASLKSLEHLGSPFALKPDAPEGERRLALARWITSDANALTARVLANRVWHYHFGVGIVDTPSDFGFLGGAPSHPDLLDWLAARLLHHGWKLKPLHREILLSQTYRQSSAFREEGGRVDKDARLLWRLPPRRLAAEEVRDTMLSLAGQLSHRGGGAGFRLYRVSENNVSTYFPLDLHGPETFRRAVYHQNARASIVDILNDYDLPDTAFSAPRRANTTTPLQALTMLNHSFTMEMAKHLAQRVQRESKDEHESIERLYDIVLQRPPTAREREAGVDFARTHGLPALCRAVWNLNELLYLD